MAAPRKKPVETSLSDDSLAHLRPTLEELAVWWQGRKTLLTQASDATQETERITFHVERRWIDAIRRQADLDGLTITHIVNRAFQSFFMDR